MAQDFLSNDFSHPNHRNAIAALIVAVLVFGILIVAYLLRPSVKPTASVAPPPDSIAVRQALLNQPNPPVNLTSEEITTRQKLLTAPNPPSKLTPQQIKARQAILTNI